MKVFISWSGEKSRVAARKLRDWIPDVIQPVAPWMSAEDIDAGARWNFDISKQLEDTSFGIICLTKANQSRPWIMFEAGALAKVLQGTFVVPYLLDLKPSEVASGPLSQFQAKTSSKEDTLQLMQTLNRSFQSPLTEERLRHVFDKFWPDLEEVLQGLPDESQGSKVPGARSVEDLLDEILLLARGIARHQETTYYLSEYTGIYRPEEWAFLWRSETLSNELAKVAPSDRQAYLVRYIENIIRKRYPELLATERNALLLRVLDNVLQRLENASDGPVTPELRGGIQLGLDQSDDGTKIE